MEEYIESWKQSFDFKGYMNKDLYWEVMLFHIIVGFLLPLPFFLFGTFTLYLIIMGSYFTIHLLPITAMTVRRLNDVNRSKLVLLLVLIPVIGWYILIKYYLMELSKEDSNVTLSDQEYAEITKGSEELKAMALFQEQAARNNMRR